MLTKQIFSKYLTLALASLLIGFAPVFHAVCLGPLHNSIDTHVMPDGSLMTLVHEPETYLEQHVGSPKDAVVISPISGVFNNIAESPDDPVSILLTVLPAVVFLFVLVYTLRQQKSFAPTAALLPSYRKREHQNTKNDSITSVNLLSLGVLRT
jgi:hypothetical protein